MARTRPKTLVKPPTVTIVVPAEIAYDIDALTTAVNTSVKNILGRYGCPTCCSGIDILFANEVEYVVNAKTFEPMPMSESVS